MTSNLKFEGLLVSQDDKVLRGMTQIIEDLSIQVDICMLSSRAVDLLERRDIDLLVVDWDTNGGSEMVRAARKSAGRRLTIGAVVAPCNGAERAIDAGANGVIYKPLTGISKAEFHCNVYHRMVAERRHERRYTVRWLVSAADVDGNPVPVTMTDLSEKGIGLRVSRAVLPDDVLKFKLLLPGTKKIIPFEARVVWTGPDQNAGAEFVEISPASSAVLREWLQDKQSVAQ